MKRLNVMIFGCGNIGFRHLQGLVKSKLKKNIYIVDKNIKQLSNIKKILSNSVHTKNNKIFFYNNLNFRNKRFDLVILATTSLKRIFFLKKIIKEKKFTNLIIEKIAFLNKKDLDDAKKITEKNKILSWINCPRNSFKVYKKIKKEINNDKKIVMNVKGKNWNMASNMIHFLDLFLFLSERKVNNFTVKIYKKNKIIKSKKKHFSELKGKIKIFNKMGDQIIFEDNDKYKNEMVLMIKDAEKQYIINETHKELNTISQNIKFNRLKFKFKMPFQSYLSKFYLEKILNNKRLEIPSLNQSYLSHIILFNILDKQFKNKKFMVS